MNKLTVGMIHQDDSEWAVMALESIEAIADEILIIDGGSEPSHLERLDKFIDGNEKYKVIRNKYPGNNGLQYQKILDNAAGDWILILDADEVVDDNAHLLKEYMSDNMSDNKSCYAIRMNHLINDLAHIDSTYAGSPQVDPNYNHYVNKRFFKNKPGIYFDGHEHGSIIGFTEEDVGVIDDVVIWHYGKSKSMIDLRNKYLMNLKRSKIHSKQFLDWWYSSHLTGTYPVKEVKLSDHPSVVKREFKL